MPQTTVFFSVSALTPCFAAPYFSCLEHSGQSERALKHTFIQMACQRNSNLWKLQLLLRLSCLTKMFTFMAKAPLWEMLQGRGAAEQLSAVILGCSLGRADCCDGLSPNYFRTWPSPKPPLGLVLPMSPGRLDRAEVRVYEVSPSTSKFYHIFPTTTCCFLGFTAQKLRLKDCRQHAPVSWRWWQDSLCETEQHFNADEGWHSVSQLCCPDTG